MCVDGRVGASSSDVSEISTMIPGLRCGRCVAGVGIGIMLGSAAAWRGRGMLCWRVLGVAGVVAGGLLGWNLGVIGLMIIGTSTRRDCTVCC